MAKDWFWYATFAAAIGSGMLAGLFFVFSNTVMNALGRLPGASGAAAMQAINATILNPLFFVLFFGTPALCIVVIIGALPGVSAPSAVCAIAGALLHLLGSFLVTIVFNVPLNNALAAARIDAAEGAAVWIDYLVRWTRWNHVRTIAGVAAAVLLTLALA